MIDAFLASGTLNIIYVVVIGISFLFAMVSLLGAEMGDVLDFDIDADADGGIDFVNISPFALAMFGATFGLVGLITRLWLDMEAIPSVLWAAGLGLAIGGVAQGLFVYVLSPSKSSHFSLDSDAVGREAEVIITIPGNGRGQITFDNVSGRVTLGARSATGRQIRTGEVVTIDKIVGRLAVVSPRDRAS